MPTRTCTVTSDDQTDTVVWTGLLNGDDGQAFQAFSFRDQSIQFGGTFGVGGSISLEGSNDNTSWFVLSDLQTSAITKTSAALEGVAEAVKFVRPRVTAGDGTTSLTATLYCARSVR
jgi:hypothetical protein